MMNLNYLMDHILYQILNYINKKHETGSNNPPMKINVNKIENRITFRIKTGYYIQRLTIETMKLLGNYLYLNKNSMSPFSYCQQ